jgi:hypothetical protein
MFRATLGFRAFIMHVWRLIFRGLVMVVAAVIWVAKPVSQPVAPTARAVEPEGQCRAPPRELQAAAAPPVALPLDQSAVTAEPDATADAPQATVVRLPAPAARTGTQNLRVAKRPAAKVRATGKRPTLVATSAVKKQQTAQRRHRPLVIVSVMADKSLWLP